MFNPGTKVTVLASSHQKGSGPRKGSFGYTSARRKSKPFESYGFVASFQEIFFFRYGFEEKLRLERSFVISLYPIIKHHGSAKPQIDKFVKNLSSAKWEKIRSDVCDHLDLKRNTPFVLFAPAPFVRTNLITCPKEEFNAWAESILHGQALIRIVNRMLIKEHYKKSKLHVINTGNLQMLSNIGVNRERKLQVFKSIESDIKIKKDFVLLLQGISAIQSSMQLRSIGEGFLLTMEVILSRDVRSGVIIYPYDNKTVNYFEEYLRIKKNKLGLVAIDFIKEGMEEILELSARLLVAGSAA